MEYTVVNPNPLELPGNIRDPFILRVDDEWYLTGTSRPFWVGQGPVPGIRLFKSRDLLHWEFVSWMLRREDYPESSWFIDRMWAPEIFRKKEGYYLTFNSFNESEAYSHPLSTAIAFSEKIEGPYRVLTLQDSILATIRHPAAYAGLIRDTNDASLFSWNGHDYMFYCHKTGIWQVEISLPECKALSEARLAVKAAPEGHWDMMIEGPCVMHHKGRFYLFYSSYSGPYSVGYVTSESPEGPWSPNPEKPLISPLKTPGVVQSGHNCVFTGPDGRWYTAYHLGTEQDQTERLAIDPIEFTPSGELMTQAPFCGRYTFETKE